MTLQKFFDNLVNLTNRLWRSSIFMVLTLSISLVVVGAIVVGAIVVGVIVIDRWSWLVGEC